MIKLSFTTISQCLQKNNSHNWANKQMGAKVPDNQYFRNGHKLHKIIQEHLSGKTPNKDLAKIPYTFPISESEFTIQINDKYALGGFLDADDPKNKRFAEIKTGSAMWSLAKFQKSFQRKVYAMAKKDYLDSVLITTLDLTEWPRKGFRVFSVPISSQDKKDALEWILDAIKLLEEGNYTGGLENGRCTNKFCYFGINCQFK